MPNPNPTQHPSVYQPEQTESLSIRPQTCIAVLPCTLLCDLSSTPSTQRSGPPLTNHCPCVAHYSSLCMHRSPLHRKSLLLAPGPSQLVSLTATVLQTSDPNCISSQPLPSVFNRALSLVPFTPPSMMVRDPSAVARFSSLTSMTLYSWGSPLPSRSLFHPVPERGHSLKQSGVLAEDLRQDLHVAESLPSKCIGVWLSRTLS